MHTHRLLWDLLFMATFIAGQLLFMLKRADLARKSPLNGVKTIRHFFALNWVVLLFRAVIEWGLVLWPYRSASNEVLQSLIHKVWANFPFQLPQHRGLVGCFFVGLGSDFLLDWVMSQKWVHSVPILNKLVENIPQIPEVRMFVSSLGTKV